MKTRANHYCSPVVLLLGVLPCCFVPRYPNDIATVRDVLGRTKYLTPPTFGFLALHDNGPLCHDQLLRFVVVGTDGLVDRRLGNPMFILG